jgi:hypothetical protein
MTRSLIALLLAAAATWAHADAQRERLQALRAQADAALAAKERDCATRFMVAGCIEAARREHREVLAQLRQDTLRIDDAQRRAAAKARVELLAEKERAQAARASEPEAEPRVRAAREPRAEADAGARDEPVKSSKPTEPIQSIEPGAPGAPAAPARPAKSVKPPPRAAASRPASNPDRATVEQRSREQFEARQRAMQSRREEVEARNAARRAQGKAAAPLPLPEGASSPR